MEDYTKQGIVLGWRRNLLCHTKLANSILTIDLYHRTL